MKIFSWQYFLTLIATAVFVVGLYFLLRKASKKTKMIVLECILIAGLILHFCKVFIKPFNGNTALRRKDIWFINLCGANIALFPFMFLSKNDRAKDYMFYFGTVSGLASVLYPIEMMHLTDLNALWMNVFRFYFHHIMIFAVPLLMVLLGLHKLSYKRVWSVPFYLIGVGMFVMVNEIIQSEIGAIPMRGTDILKVPYQNTSLIWGPDGTFISKPFDALCPKIFKTIPFGPHKGETKYWPIIWIIIPVFVYFIPYCFLISLIFDHKNFIRDMKNLFARFKKKKTA